MQSANEAWRFLLLSPLLLLIVFLRFLSVSMTISEFNTVIDFGLLLSSFGLIHLSSYFLNICSKFLLFFSFSHYSWLVISPSKSYTSDLCWVNLY